MCKRLSWKSVQGWFEILSNYVAQHNWTDFQLKMLCFVCYFLSFMKIAFSLQKEEDCWKIKRKKEILDRFQLKKGQFLDRCSTLQHIYREREKEKDREREREEREGERRREKEREGERRREKEREGERLDITWGSPKPLYLSSRRLSGPTATVILSRYTIALHSVALRFPGFGRVSLRSVLKASRGVTVVQHANMDRNIFSNQSTKVLRCLKSQKFRKGVGGRRGLARGNPTQVLLLYFGHC